MQMSIKWLGGVFKCMMISKEAELTFLIRNL